MTLVCIDSGIFLCLAFKDPGYRFCGKLLDDVFTGKIRAVISSIQISELYTAFKRAGDLEGLNRMKNELFKLGLKIRDVDQEISELSSEYRAKIKTPEGKWLPLADSIILATAKVEKANILYTIDIDFLNVKDIKIMAPEMSLPEWVRKFGTNRQKKILRSIID